MANQVEIKITEQTAKEIGKAIQTAKDCGYLNVWIGSKFSSLEFRVTLGNQQESLGYKISGWELPATSETQKND